MCNDKLFWDKGEWKQFLKKDFMTTNIPIPIGSRYCQVHDSYEHCNAYLIYIKYTEFGDQLRGSQLLK